jgi:PRTRC genetic system protein B
MEDEVRNFDPVNILKMYKNPDKGFYIEIHPVYKQKENYRIGAGKPLTKKTLQKLLGAAMSDDSKNIWWEHPILPECILSFCSEKYKRHILWWRPKTLYQMSFDERLKLKSGLVSMPALLFFSKLDKIKIFALKENKRPTIKTKLFIAPLLNSIADNELCWGNVSNQIHNIMEIDKEINTWENYIWNSNFSHGGSVKATKHSIIEIYQKIGHKPFPIRELIDTKLIVNDLIEKL